MVAFKDRLGIIWKENPESPEMSSLGPKAGIAFITLSHSQTLKVRDRGRSPGSNSVFPHLDRQTQKKPNSVKLAARV